MQRFHNCEQSYFKTLLHKYGKCHKTHTLIMRYDDQCVMCDNTEETPAPHDIAPLETMPTIYSMLELDSKTTDEYLRMLTLKGIWHSCRNISSNFRRDSTPAYSNVAIHWHLVYHTVTDKPHHILTQWHPHLWWNAHQQVKSLAEQYWNGSWHLEGQLYIHGQGQIMWPKWHTCSWGTSSWKVMGWQCRYSLYKTL